MVSPVDGGYQYYSRSINELEDELKKDYKRAKERAAEQVSDLEEAQTETREKESKRIEETVNQIRENMSEEVARERNAATKEVQRMRDQMYDRFGRFNGMEADVLTSQLEMAKQQLEKQEIEHRRQTQDIQDSNAEKVASLNQRHADNLEKAVGETRNSAYEAYHSLYQDGTNNYLRDSDNLKEQYRKLYQARADDIAHQHRETERAISDAKLDYDYRLRNQTQSDDTRFRDFQAQMERKQQNQTDYLKRIHEDQQSDLRGNIRDLINAKRESIKSQAEGRRDAYLEFEDEFRARERQMKEATAAEVDQAKNQGQLSEINLAYRNAENLRNKDEQIANYLRRTGEEYSVRENDLKGTYERQLAEQKKHFADQIARNEGKESKKTAAFYEQQDKVLQTQSETARKEIARQAQENDATVALLENQIRDLRTTNDTSKISPAAEESLRRSVQNQYEKVFQEDEKRNNRTIESIQKEYSQRVNDTVDEAKAKETLLRQRFTSEQKHATDGFLESVNEVQSNAREQIQQKDIDHERQTDLLSRNYSKMFEKQRAQYEELLQATRNDAASRVETLQQQAEFAERHAQRDFAMQTKQMIRDYEKRLEEQKTQYEDMIEGMKADHEKVVRQAEKQFRADLENATRSNEQRIAQLNQQQEEREAFLRNSYEDQLDRVKKSNARLIQKTS